MSSSAEVWRPARGFDGYEVSDRGRVRCLVPGRIGRPRAAGLVKQFLSGGREKRWSVNLYGTSRRVHLLVLEAFVGPCPPGLEGCHTNGDGLDNKLTNLRWDTHAANMQDRLRHGRNPSANATECPKRHEYTPENTRIYRGKRHCRACDRERRRVE